MRFGAHARSKTSAKSCLVLRATTLPGNVPSSFRDNFVISDTVVISLSKTAFRGIGDLGSALGMENKQPEHRHRTHRTQMMKGSAFGREDTTVVFAMVPFARARGRCWCWTHKVLTVLSLVFRNLLDQQKKLECLNCQELRLRCVFWGVACRWNKLRKVRCILFLSWVTLISFAVNYSKRNM